MITFEACGKIDDWYNDTTEPYTVTINGNYHTETGREVIKQVATGQTISGTRFETRWCTLWSYSHEVSYTNNVYEDVYGETLKVIYPDKEIIYKIGDEWLDD